MIQLYNNETDAFIGTISEEQLRMLVADLEEEDPEDQDYYINEPTLAWMEGQGADPALVGMLRQVLGDREGVEIRWERT